MKNINKQSSWCEHALQTCYNSLFLLNFNKIQEIFNRLSRQLEFGKHGMNVYFKLIR